MAAEFSFGYLYIPTLKGGIFRDVFLFVEDQLYLRDYLRCGSASRLFESVIPFQVSQLQQISLGDVADVASILGTVPVVAKAVSKLWRKLARFHNRPEESSKVWPKALSATKGQFHKYLFNGMVDLKSDGAALQRRRIVAEAEEELKVFRVAFSDDLVDLYQHLDRTKRGCEVELNLASAESLQAACDNELTELAKRSDLFDNLREEFDFQAKSKYLKDATANFARAACDSLCAISACQNYLERSATLDDAQRFQLCLFKGAPTFRGTITEKEIGYVSTEPWQPGMVGNLHAHTLDDDTAKNWGTAKKKFLSEVRSSMKPKQLEFADATKQLLTPAVRAIYESERRSGKTREDVQQIEKMIRAIPSFRAASRSDVPEMLKKITDHRALLRSEFGAIFSRLDESLVP